MERYHVIDRVNGGCTTFESAHDVGIHLLGWDLNDAIVVKDDGKNAKVVNIKDPDIAVMRERMEATSTKWPNPLKIVQFWIKQEKRRERHFQAAIREQQARVSRMSREDDPLPPDNRKMYRTRFRLPIAFEVVNDGCQLQCPDQSVGVRDSGTGNPYQSATSRGERGTLPYPSNQGRGLPTAVHEGNQGG